ncbi:hypothetical protein M404DRAFT_559976 [Pisolithus tinctorius Marx 270]|uniref:Uncharacterized protein n=1 Tax=Pisolithus tinctorius Marx 270 TaxID=870435 RepID=A0A0C3KU54_PISTI|nr:hypothetical protein M404DRAFT_559976 [Pisolithus tinctorius Marx 270]
MASRAGKHFTLSPIAPSIILICPRVPYSHPLHALFYLHLPMHVYFLPHTHSSIPQKSNHPTHLPTHIYEPRIITFNDLQISGLI